MRIEEYGKDNEKTIVMLHGAHMIHTFQRQYVLAQEYHIIVPHIVGFGNHTDQIFETRRCISELAEYIRTLNKKVYLIGFSLGAQLAFHLISEYEELFESAIIVSAWLIKEEPLLSEIMELNRKQLNSLQNKFLCGITGLANGLTPKQCREFVIQMQHVNMETVHNMVYNGISLEDIPEFGNVTVPIIALAGAKEPKPILDSARRMSEENSNCRYEVWDKAGHNIPICYYKRFNKLICNYFT